MNAPLDRVEEPAPYDIWQRLNSDVALYREMARFRGVPDTPLGRALLMAADRYEEAAAAIRRQQYLLEDLVAIKNRWETELLAVYAALGVDPDSGYEGAAQRVREALTADTQKQ